VTSPGGLEERVIAAANLVGRSGASEFEIGYLHDDVPSAEAGWYAQARYRGARIIADDCASPVEAVEALARRLLTGARCGCGKFVALGDEGASAFDNWAMSDGSPFPADEAKAIGLCLWQRKGARWVSACGLGEYPT